MGTIPSQTIEQIAAANDIVEVIGSYFPLKRAGTNLKALCPFHQEKTASFTVNPSRQTFHCFGCGVGGSVFRFVMDYEHTDFPSAVRKLAARAGIPIVEERGAIGDDDRQHEARRTLLKLHAEAAEWFHENLIKKDFAAPARAYLKERAIDRKIVDSWQLGFAPESWDACLRWGLDRGYRRAQLVQSGLLKLRDERQTEGEVYDRFRSRIMFPICNDVGEVIAFSGRILEKEVETAKYLNSPETPLFRKGNILFGLHKTKRGLIEANCAIVCEGQLDLITLFEVGITNVVAPQGTAFTEQQARILKRFVSEVVLCFDADAAGQKAAERSLDALLQNDLIIRVAEMPGGEDPDSLVRNKGKQAFEKHVHAAREFFDYWIEREVAVAGKASLAERVHVAHRLAQTINQVPDETFRGRAMERLTFRLALPAAELQRLLPARPNLILKDTPSQTVPIAPPQAIKQLCRLAIHDSEFREFLRSQDWNSVLIETPGSEILSRILGSDFEPGSPGSIDSFLSSLEPEERQLVSEALVEKKPPSNDRDMGYQWWNSLRVDIMRRQMQLLNEQMKEPGVSPGEEIRLQKEILDLQEQLHDVPRFSSARVRDG